MRRVRSARPSAEHLRQGNAWPCPFLPKRSFWTGTWRSTQRELLLAQPPKTHHNIRTRWRFDLFINLREDEPGYERWFSHLFLLCYVEWLTDSDVRDIRGINPTLYWIHLSSSHVLSGTGRGTTRWASEKLDPERGGFPEPNFSFIPLSLPGYSQRLQEDI